MKKLFVIATVAVALCTVPLLAHHAAEGMVDEEVYEMIDSMIANTPHATWSPPQDLGGGVTETIISTRTIRPLERMIDDGLLTYFAMLDGDVLVSMTFNSRGGVMLTLTQVE